MAGPNPALLGVGAVALFFMSRKRSGKASEEASASEGASASEEASASGGHPAWAHGDHVDTCMPPEEVLALSESPAGRPLLGKLYQVVSGDNHLRVARKALFGSSEPRVDPIEREAVIDLSIRMDCGPWNQTVNSAGKGQLGPGHYAAERGYTDRGILYMPLFPDNRERMMGGAAPMVGRGSSFPYIWIPMIDLDVFMTTGEVTTKGQNWPDEDGEGEYSKINPPPWVLDLAFEGDLNAGVVGCELPEGDFRQTLEVES